MSSISFRVVSVELKEQTITKLNPRNLFRLNITQRPHHVREEYLVNESQGLYNINHEFEIEDKSNTVQRITLTLRTVEKKFTLSNLFGISQTKQKKDHNIDNFVGSNTNVPENIQYEYYEPAHSLIGYCTVNIEELKKGVNNQIRAELLTRGKEVKCVGYANLEVYVWRINKPSGRNPKALFNNSEIVFIDPGCPPPKQATEPVSHI